MSDREIVAIRLLTQIIQLINNKDLVLNRSVDGDDILAKIASLEQRSERITTVMQTAQALLE